MNERGGGYLKKLHNSFITKALKYEYFPWARTHGALVGEGV